MKSPRQVEKKLADVTSRHLQRAVKKGLRKSPENCKYNSYHDLGHTSIRICTYSEVDPSWKVDICETSECAKNCPFFTASHSRESIEKEFDSHITDDEFLKHHYRDIYMLKWVLSEQSKQPSLAIRLYALFVSIMYQFHELFFIGRLKDEQDRRHPAN